MTPNQKSNLISNYRQAVSDLILAANKLTNLRAEYDALDTGSLITDEDFVGDNAGLNRDAFVGAITVVNGILDGVSGAPKSAIYRIKL